MLPWHRINCTIIILLAYMNNYATYTDIALENLVGTLPAKITLIIHHLKQHNSQDIFEPIHQETRPLLIKNRLLLYGPPGNGKSTLAYKIADISGSEFIKLDGPSIVGSYIGQGAHAIKDFFEQGRNIAAATGKCVILFIDEIDAIAANNKTEFRAEHQAALQQLWLELDACRHAHNLFIIFATNNFTKLNKTFLDRFGSNTIEIEHPETLLRTQVLQHYCTLHNVPINQNTINHFAEMSEGLSIRSLEDFVEELSALHITKSEAHVSVQEMEQILKKIIKKFSENTSEEADKQESALQRLSLHVSIISGTLSAALTLYQFYHLLKVNISNNFYALNS